MTTPNPAICNYRTNIWIVISLVYAVLIRSRRTAVLVHSLSIPIKLGLPLTNQNAAQYWQRQTEDTVHVKPETGVKVLSIKVTGAKEKLLHNIEIEVNCEYIFCVCV